MCIVPFENILGDPKHSLVKKLHSRLLATQSGAEIKENSSFLIYKQIFSSKYTLLLPKCVFLSLKMFWAVRNTVWLKLAFKIGGYPKWAEIREYSSFLIG